MKSFSFVAILLTALFSSTQVFADVTVAEQVLQKGVFLPDKCNGTEECMCQTDISYPIISGMKDTTKQGVINTLLKQKANQLQCKGTPAASKGKGPYGFSVIYKYDVTFQSQGFLGFKFTDWAYEGGAHGNTLLEGMIIDLDTGKVLTVSDVFGKNASGVNQVIYSTLIPKAEDVFHDQIEERKSHFIENGQCTGCILTLGKDGINVIFQTYEVAPFADGNPTITIPAQLVAYPGLAASGK